MKSLQFKISMAIRLLSRCLRGVGVGVFGFTQIAIADADFLTALQAAQQQDWTALSGYEQQWQAQNSILAPYPTYWRLNNNLSAQPVEKIVAFAQQYPQAAITEKLLADYAEAQAKMGRYDAVRQVAFGITNPDQSEQCALTQAQAVNGDRLILGSLKDQVWLTTEKLPDLCQTVARQILQSPLVNSADKQQRLWTMLRVDDRDDAIDVAGSLGLPISREQLAQIAANPDAQLLIPLQNDVDQSLFLYAFARLADRSLESAVNVLAQPTATLSAKARAYAYRILAMETTGRYVVNNGFDRRTVAWFDQSSSYPFSDEEAQTYARHAIRMSAWESVLKALDQMSFDTQQKREWQYWFARAAEQRQEQKYKDIARNFYQALAGETDYYGLLSRDRLGLKTTSLGVSYQPTSDDYARLDRNVHFQRAFLLRNLGVDASYANREWNWAVKQANTANDDGMILAAAQRANQIEWYDRSIYATERTLSKFNPNLRYPTPYREQVLQYSQNVALDPAWAYGLMRQESRFVIHAKSNVGASGLMQIMPDTARWVAGKLGESYNATQAKTMDTNIRYGTFYLSHILQQLSNQPVLATAGYNAGPTRAKRWQPLSQNLPADQYTESIPFLETRDYVKNVMTNATHYQFILNRPIQTLGQRMGEIPVQSNAGIEGP